ncbi:hypothetical protein J6A31_08890 [bacterium]|nr:hypothetical protein [bacterium]
MLTKTFTFEIHYDKSIDNYGSIQFCAETKDEAISLFKDHCFHEFGTTDVKINDIEVVFDKYDEDEYGLSYGTPEEYKLIAASMDDSIAEMVKIVGEPLYSASGYIGTLRERYEINTSDILSELIRTAGRLCDSYASDLFITWGSIDDMISTRAEFDKTYNFVFAFR